MENELEKIDNIAREVLILSRNILLVNLRFLDAALSQFELYPMYKYTIMTDGKHIFYNPRHVLKMYQSAKEISVRDYLHIVMHCIFRHMYVNPGLNHTYWNLACDIAVENMITGLNLKPAYADRERLQIKYISKLKNELKYMTAENIYSYLCKTKPDIEEIQDYFYADNHEIWYMAREEIEKDIDDDLGDGNHSIKDLNQIGISVEMSDVWRKISERIQVDLETFGKKQGVLSDSMIQNLAAVNREKCDYTEFLKKFAIKGESRGINDDEFDYIFYTYGLELYKNMPLIEPLEYKEVNAIKEFVIAIDTSGSTSGRLVQKFVQKTYNIFKSTESFFSRVNLHIIQCDADIKEDKKITCQEEFDEYLKTMKIRGHGGTDFRPVFEYVENMRQSKEFRNLKGLIYFTDGFGTFPEKKPDYDTAFIFIDDEYNNPDVPPWAIKLVLQENEI